MNNKKKYIDKRPPWHILFIALKHRCKKGYGKNQNIQFKFNNILEIKTLWIRDKAYLMDFPTIDRINNNEGYYYENCHFVERSENSRKAKLIDYPCGYIYRQCETCGKMIKCIPSRFKRQPQRFCSERCRGKSQNYVLYNTENKKCKFCQRVFNSKTNIRHLYCSPQCNWKAQWEKRKGKVAK